MRQTRAIGLVPKINQEVLVQLQAAIFGVNIHLEKHRPFSVENININNFDGFPSVFFFAVDYVKKIATCH